MVMFMEDSLKREFYIEMCKLEKWSSRQLHEHINSHYSEFAIRNPDHRFCEPQIINRAVPMPGFVLSIVLNPTVQIKVMKQKINLDLGLPLGLRTILFTRSLTTLNTIGDFLTGLVLMLR
jgi:hypothetical protein